MASHRIASGSTNPDSTAWQVYTGMGIYVDVDTSAANFDSVPAYITSIGGEGCHWSTTGASAVYLPTAKGFRVYIRWIDGGPLTPANAKKWKWRINWIGMEI